jgi:hypothetical protein
MGTDRFAQTAANAVAHNRVADLLGDGIADTRNPAVAPIQGFNEKKPSTPLFTASDS